MLRARSFRSLVVPLAVALSLTGTVAAHAEDEATPDQIKYAAEEFTAGAKAFRSGNFAEAAEHYENSFREVPTKPSVLRAAIQNRVKAKQKARAATLAALALVRFPDDHATVALAKEVLASSEKSLARVNASCKEPCALFIDSAITPYKPTKSAVLYLEPGPHSVAASFGEKRNDTKKIDGAAGATIDLAFTAPAVVVVPPPTAAAAAPTDTAAPVEDTPPPPVVHKPVPRWVFFTAAGVTTVIAGVTAWSAIDMRSNPGKAKVEADCIDLGSACPTFQDGLSAQRRTNTLLGVSAGALVATGVLGLFFTDFHPAAAPATASRASTPTPRRLSLRPVVTPLVPAGGAAGGGSGLHVGAYGTF
jgi:hypothetical protein